MVAGPGTTGGVAPRTSHYYRLSLVELVELVEPWRSWPQDWQDLAPWLVVLCHGAVATHVWDGN